MSEKKLNVPFETATVDGKLMIALPANIKDLTKHSVFRSMLFCIQSLNMHAVVLKDDYTFNTVLNDKQQLAHDSFAMNIISDTITECPSKKSMIKKALISSVHYMLQGKGVDVSLLKKSQSILDLCFATKATKVKPIERKIIDMLINVAKKKEISSVDFSSYLVSGEEIKRAKGLSISINEKIWSNSELEFIKLLFEGEKISKSLNLDISNVKKVSEILTLQIRISEWYTKTSKIKKAIKKIVNSRMRDIYPRKSGKVDKQFKSKKIEDVIALSKGTDRHLVMNPTKVLSLVLKPEFMAEFDKEDQYFFDKEGWDEYVIGILPTIKDIHPRMKGFLISLENDFKLFLKNLNLS
jgi:hypothetical protein